MEGRWATTETNNFQGPRWSVISLPGAVGTQKKINAGGWFRAKIVSPMLLGYLGQGRENT